MSHAISQASVVLVQFAALVFEVQERSPLLVCVPLVVLAVLLGVSLCTTSLASDNGKPKNTCSVQDLAGSVVFRISSMGCLVAGLRSTEPQVKLLAGVFLASTPGVAIWETAAFLSAWVAGVTATGHLNEMSWWVPFLVLLGRVVERKSIEPKAAVWSLGSLSGCNAKTLQAPSLLPGLSSSQEPPEKPIDNKSDAYRRSVKCISNWAPPTDREVRSWKKLFSLSDELIATYACSVSAKISHQGRLYISTEHIAFHGVAVITHAVRFAIDFGKIQEIDNGGNRESATLQLKSPMTIKGMSNSVSSIQLQGCCEAAFQAIASLLSMGDAASDSGDGSESHDEVAQEEEKDVVQQPCSAAAQEAIACLDNTSPFQVLIDARVPRTSTNQLADELMAAEWSDTCWFMRLQSDQGVMEALAGPWMEDLDGSCTVPAGSTIKIREITGRVAVPPAPMCPRSTKVTATYRFTVNSSVHGKTIKIEDSTISHDVPFGDKFVTQGLTEISPLPDDDGGVHVRKQGRCVFVKSVGLLQSRIQSSALKGVSNGGEKLVCLLRSLAPLQTQDVPKALPSKSIQDARATCTIQIWELQRRTTIFHTEFRAPFLPHDGKKRWRWVDSAFQLHPWLTAKTRAEAALMDTPPIKPLRGWEPEGEWRTSEPSAATDLGGWQYAADFYRRDSLWNHERGGKHCRRRLWTCNFVEIVESSSPVNVQA